MSRNRLPGLDASSRLIVLAGLLAAVLHAHSGAAQTMGHGTMPSGPVKKVAVLLYDHTVLLDYAIPAELFRAAGHGQIFQVFTVARTKDPVAGMVTGPVVPDYAFATAPEADVVVVPGGMTDAAVTDPATVAWLRERHDRGAWVFSVCTGAYVLGRVGMLDGRRATSLHSQIDLLRSLAPKALVVPDAPFVADRRMLTAAGAGTAIDATLRLIAELAGQPLADWLADEYLDYRRRQGGAPHGPGGPRSDRVR